MIAPPRRPTHDEREALIKEARERQLRRRLLAAAGVAIAAAIGLGVYAFVTGGHTDRGNSDSRNVRGAVPLCRASQLSSTAGLNGAAFGTMMGTVILTNRSAVACAFPTGRPHVDIFWRGSVLPTREAGDRTRGRPIPVLGPHSGAAIDMFWTNGCGRLGHGPVVDPIFRLSWPGRLVVDVPNGVAVRPRCNGGGVSVISVGRPYRNALLAP
jgi:hypothetical protein